MRTHEQADEFKPDRTLLPRALVRRRPAFAFKVGQTVSSGDLIAVVTDRRRSAAGREIYNVAVVGADYGRPQRTFLGQYLSPTH